MRTFTISIDTEADTVGKTWIGRSPESYENIQALENRLLPVTKAHNAPVTLLLNYDVITRSGPSTICQRLRDSHGWELGTHLHGELVQPDQRFPSPAGHRFHEFQCSYSAEVERRKMQELTEAYRLRFGSRPQSFRAGRYGASPRTFDICLDLGYEVDSSVVPGLWFEQPPAVADFRRFDVCPSVVAKSTKGHLIEIPITVRKGLVQKPPPSASKSSIRRPFDYLQGKACAAATRLVKPWNSPSWLRPSYNSSGGMIRLLDWLKARREPVVANMMFHSNELAAGASPYNATSLDVESFMTRIEAVLIAAAERDFRFMTLADAAQSLSFSTAA